MSVSKLIISSFDRDGAQWSSASNFEIILPDAITIKKFIIENITVPFSYYVINSNTNTLQFQVGVTTYTATIPVGNYSSPELATELQTAMNAQYAGFTVTYNANNYHFTITHGVDNFTLLLSSSTINTIIGFGIVNVGPTMSASSTNAAIVTGPNFLFLHSNVLSAGLKFHPYQNLTKTNIISVIPVNNNPGDIISYSPGFNIGYEFEYPKVLSVIDLRLTDGDNAPIDLNGLNFDISLIIIN
jgi:hypothetical protein